MPDDRPPIICSTISVFSKPIDAAFPLFARTGFDGIELMVTNDPDTQDSARVRALSEDHALPVLAVHAPFLLMSRRVWGRDPLGKIDRAIELALGIGAPLVVVHPPYRWQSAYRRWLDEALPNVAAERGIRVAVENMFPLRVRGRNVARFHAHQSLEDGVLDLGPFLEALAGRRFRGAISLEIDLRSHLDDDQALRRILSRNRELCEAGLTLPA